MVSGSWLNTDWYCLNLFCKFSSTDFIWLVFFFHFIISSYLIINMLAQRALAFFLFFMFSRPHLVCHDPLLITVFFTEYTYFVFSFILFMLDIFHKFSFHLAPPYFLDMFYPNTVWVNHPWHPFFYLTSVCLFPIATVWGFISGTDLLRPVRWEMNALYFLIIESQYLLHNEVSLCWAMTFLNFRSLSTNLNHAEQSTIVYLF